MLNVEIALLNVLNLIFNLEYIQSDSKPLRQTLRVDRVNNKEYFLLNNLCILTCRFEVTIDFC